MRISKLLIYSLSLLSLAMKAELPDKKCEEKKPAETATAGVIRVTSKKQYESLKTKEIPLVIKYSKKGCDVCDLMAPVYEAIAGDEKYKGKADFIELCESDGPEISAIIENAEITAVPTFEVAYQGQTQRKVGASSKEDLEPFIVETLEAFEPAKWSGPVLILTSTTKLLNFVDRNRRVCVYYTEKDNDGDELWKDFQAIAGKGEIASRLGFGKFVASTDKLAEYVKDNMKISKMPCIAVYKDGKQRGKTTGMENDVRLRHYIVRKGDIE